MVGVGVALLGLAEALLAAALAPGLPWPVRGGRIAIDLVLVAGFLAYLRGDRTPVVRRSWPVRVLGVALVLAGGIFALVAPGVDPWRRAFRAALAVALAVAIALGMGRTVPAGWLRRAKVLTFAFVIVELVVGIVATIEIDAPVAVAGLGPTGRTVTARLDDGGYALPRPLASIVVATAPDALVLRHGRLVATTRLADTLHLLGDDPVPALARVLADPRLRNAWRFGRIDDCTMLRILRPPLRGYRDPRYGAELVAAVRVCALNGAPMSRGRAPRRSDRR